VTKKKSLDELREELAPYIKKYEFKTIMHIETCTRYWVYSIHFKEDDMSIWFAYHVEGDLGVSFSRPIAELLDGRFEL